MSFRASARRVLLTRGAAATLTATLFARLLKVRVLLQLAQNTTLLKLLVEPL